MARIKATVTAVVAALLVGACGQSLDHGTVTGKSHVDSYVTTTWVFTGKVLIPIPASYPERWALHLRDREQDDWHDVTEDEYARYQVGDVYP